MHKCLHCDNITNNPKFCSSSCAAKFNNTNRILKNPNKTKTGICSCGKEVVVNVRASKKQIKCFACKKKKYKCKYCGEIANYKLNNGTYCCMPHYSQCNSNRIKNSVGLKLAYINGIKKPTEIIFDENNYNAFIEAGKNATKRKVEKIKEKCYGVDIIVLSSAAKKYLIEENNKCCERCKNTLWNGLPIPLEIDHIDGNRYNNVKSNLRVLCPNCHAQTHTFKGKNIKQISRYKDELDIIQMFNETKNIHQTLLKLKMATSGANYFTIQKILTKYKIQY